LNTKVCDNQRRWTPCPFLVQPLRANRWRPRSLNHWVWFSGPNRFPRWCSSRSSI